MILQNQRVRAFLALALLFCLPLSLHAEQVIFTDSDGDGLSDQYEDSIGTETYLSDTDGDGISDGLEVGDNLDHPLDTDGDKRINALDYDDDNDGLPSFLESKADTDNDGKKDYLDSDSDNDGISDGIEAGMLNQDKNHDGVDDAFDVDYLVGAVDKNGDGIDDDLKLPDHNNDGIPDYLDQYFTYSADKKLLSKKNKVEGKALEVVKQKLATPPPSKSNENVVVAKVVAAQEITTLKADTLKTAVSKIAEKILPIVKENEKTSPKKVVKNTLKKPKINRNTDTDNDGLLDSQERSLGTNPLKRDTDGDTVSDAIEIGMDINAPQDSDHDGIIDALDPDDDNDGILTKLEDLNKDGSAINDDTDEDGVPNYLDGNDDGDNRLTLEEGTTKDTDKDGVLDYLDNDDGLNIPAKQIATNGKKAEETEEPEIIVLFDGAEDSLLDMDESNSYDNNTNFDSALAGKKETTNKKAENKSLVAKLIDKVVENNNIGGEQPKEAGFNDSDEKKPTKVASWNWKLF